MTIARRNFLSLLPAALQLVLAPRLLAKTASGDPKFVMHELSLASGPSWARHVLVMVPAKLDPARRYPTIIGLHGYSQPTPTSRSRYFYRDHYKVLDAYEHLRTQSLAEHASQHRFFPAERAEILKADLNREPFQDAILVCPVTLIPYFQKHLRKALSNYADWIQESLLPEVGRQTPASIEPQTVGLTGVSMGGYVGLELMCIRPELFGAFCGLQADLKGRNVWYYARRLQRAFERTGPRPLQLVTSKFDPYRDANRALHRVLERLDVDCELLVTRGYHNAAWMQQVGCVEALHFLTQHLTLDESTQRKLQMASVPTSAGAKATTSDEPGQETAAKQ